MGQFNRFMVVLDGCALFPMLVREVLQTLVDHELFNPKWSGGPPLRFNADQVLTPRALREIARRISIGEDLA